MTHASSLLNEVHFQERQAERHLSSKRYDSAINCHNKAIEYLNLCLKEYNSLSVVKESLNEQIKYHNKHLLLIRIMQKKLQMQQINRESNLKTKSNEFQVDLDVHNIKLNLLRNLDELNSLLKYNTFDGQNHINEENLFKELKDIQETLKAEFEKLFMKVNEIYAENAHLKLENESLKTYNNRIRPPVSHEAHAHSSHPSSSPFKIDDFELPPLPKLELPKLETLKFRSDIFNNSQELKINRSCQGDY